MASQGTDEFLQADLIQILCHLESGHHRSPLCRKDSDDLLDVISSRVTFVQNSESCNKHMKSGKHSFHGFFLLHSESFILLNESEGLGLLDLRVSLMSHLERVKDRLCSLFVSDLFIFCIGYGVEKNGPCLVMILEGLLLSFCHLASGDSFSFSIFRMFIAFNDNIPSIYIKAKKKTFYSVLPVVKFLTIKDGRFCTVGIVFIFKRTSHLSFSHAPDRY